MAVILVLLGIVAWWFGWQTMALLPESANFFQSVELLLLILIGSVLIGAGAIVSAVDQVRQAIKPTKPIFSRLYIQDEPKKPENGG